MTRRIPTTAEVDRERENLAKYRHEKKLEELQSRMEAALNDVAIALSLLYDLSLDDRVPTELVGQVVDVERALERAERELKEDWPDTPSTNEENLSELLFERDKSDGQAGHPPTDPSPDYKRGYKEGRVPGQPRTWSRKR